MKHIIFLFFVLILPLSAHAIGIDLLGEVSKPLVGAAKDKTQGILKYLWAQPYGGYAFGDGDLQVYYGSALDYSNSLKIEGLMFGGRGGFEIFSTFRVGVDYTKQFGRRSEKISDSSGAGIIIKNNVTSINSMLGICAGMDVPHTPIQAFGARYFQADLQADTDTTGDGWGGGISFTIVNPFILIAEYRKINYTSNIDSYGYHAERTIKQYYLGLSFLLL